MTRDGCIGRGGWWVAIQVTLMFLVLALAPVFRGQWHDASVMTAGVVLLIAGGYFGVAGVRALGRNLTPYPKPLDDSVLVQHGVYAWVRHPLYSSVMFVSVGWALLWASWVGLATAGALILLLCAKASREEQWLRERFSKYREYERRVRRFVPGLW